MMSAVLANEGTTAGDFVKLTFGYPTTWAGWIPSVLAIEDRQQAGIIMRVLFLELRKGVFHS